MIKKNIITFVIPSLNRDTITRTVNSLLNQTNTNWRCIIVYDGVDGTQFDDPRIKILKIEKKGLIGPHNGQSGLVRNEGINQVTTEWIGFLDDDDTVDPNYVETLVTKYLDKDFVVWRMKYVNGIVLPKLGSNDLIFGDVGISFCYKNKFDNLLFDCNRNGEDFDLLMKLKNLTDNWVVAPEIYYNVRH
jgi:glycosyltransferase involved in cell wall biosynthesis